MTFGMFDGFMFDTVRSGSNKIVLECEEGYVSYLAISSVGPETALVVKKPGKGHGKFWNLRGDHSDAYKAAYEKGGFKAMKAYFRKHLDEQTSWSEY